MVPIRFQKQQAEYIAECLKSGKAISPRDGAWNLYEMLTLAGALYFACMSQGPSIGADKDRHHEMASEHQEAVEDSFTTDMRAAIQFCGVLVQKVVDDEYDEEFGETVEAVLSTVDGETQVRPGLGFKRKTL